MIKITYTETSKTFEVKVNGHANYKPKGEDVVCASVSALTITLALCLSNIHNGYVKTPVIDIDEGKAHIKVLPTNKAKGEVKRAIYQTLVGYSMIAEAFKEYVNFEMVK